MLFKKRINNLKTKASDIIKEMWQYIKRHVYFRRIDLDFDIAKNLTI